MNFRFSNHALEEMEKRKVPISFVEAILENPQQTLQQDQEITIYQSQRLFEKGCPRYSSLPQGHQNTEFCGDYPTP